MLHWSPCLSTSQGTPHPAHSSFRRRCAACGCAARTAAITSSPGTRIPCGDDSAPPLAILFRQHLTARQHQACLSRSERGTEAPDSERVSSLSHPVLQLGEVEPIRNERIAPIAAQQPIGTQPAPLPRDEHTNLIGWYSRLLIAPEGLRQPGRRHRSAACHQQHLQQDSCLTAPKIAVAQTLDHQATKHTNSQQRPAHPGSLTRPPLPFRGPLQQRGPFHETSASYTRFRRKLSLAGPV